jgi:hypothetical protein
MRPYTRTGSALAAAAVSVVIAACGSSSSPSSQSASTASGPNGARGAAMAACLKKQGITPPSRLRGNGSGGPPGGAGAPPAGGGLFGGGNGGPAGNGRFRAALRKCGIRAFVRRRGSFVTTPAGRAALARFTACVKKNGYALPPPNLSGSGPVFDPRKVNRTDPKFVAAVGKCQALIPRPPGPGAGGGPPPGA